MTATNLAPDLDIYRRFVVAFSGGKDTRAKAAKEQTGSNDTTDDDDIPF